MLMTLPTVSYNRVNGGVYWTARELQASRNVVKTYIKKADYNLATTMSVADKVKLYVVNR